MKLKVKLPSQSRLCEGDFITEYLNYTDSQESPEDYHFWMACSIVGSALGRDCYVDRGHYLMFPNLYTILVAESALLHKSTAIRMAMKILKAAINEEEQVYISQKVTPEALTHAIFNFSEDKGHSSAVISTDELSVFLGKAAKDPALIQLLTDLYDSQDSWSYTTMARGVETMKNIFITFMGGSTPDWLKSSLPEDAVGGGFMSRLLLIYRKELGKPPIAFPEDVMDAGADVTRANLVNDLRLIHRMKGTFTWEQSAKAVFEQWYHMNIEEMPQAAPQLRGYLGRKGETIIKLGMILSAAEGNSLKLKKHHIQTAMEHLIVNEEYMRAIYHLMGTSKEGDQRQKIFASIKRKGAQGISHSQLMQNHSHKVDKIEMANIIGTLQEADMIREEISGRRKRMYYAK